MYNTIICTQNCAFQKDGKCEKITTVMTKHSKNCNCVFFAEKSIMKADKNYFWTHLIQNYYN